MAIARSAREDLKLQYLTTLKVFYLEGSSFHLFNRFGTATQTIFLDKDVDKQTAPWLLSEFGGSGWYKNTDQGFALEAIESYTRDAVESWSQGSFADTV